MPHIHIHATLLEKIDRLEAFLTHGPACTAHDCLTANAINCKWGWECGAWVKAHVHPQPTLHAKIISYDR